MRVIAYTYVRNEEDIIRESLTHMLEQGIEVYVLDNWSTDQTLGIVQEIANEYPGRVRFERFPPEGPSRWFNLASTLRQIEAVHAEQRPDWGILFGADELMESPWPWMELPQALRYIASRGYTAVPTVEARFHPVDDGWRPGISMKKYFQYWDFGRLENVRAWRASSFEFLHGGHDVDFPSYRLWPGERIVLRHYPFRNQRQAERKVFVERQPRYAPEERRIGWHTHLDHIRPGHCFIRNAAELRKYDLKTFYEEVQRCRVC